MISIGGCDVKSRANKKKGVTETAGQHCVGNCRSLISEGMQAGSHGFAALRPWLPAFGPLGTELSGGLIDRQIRLHPKTSG